MNSICNAYMQEICEMHPAISARFQAEMDDWDPIDPPITVIFSDIGDEISRNFDKMCENEIVAIFLKIEDGANSSDESLSSAVLAGIVEGMSAIAHKDPRLWAKIMENFGPKSLQHAVAWSPPRAV